MDEGRDLAREVPAADAGRTETEPAADAARRVVSRGIWFGESARPLAGWLSHGHDGIGDSGIVIAPPVGYPYWCSHRSLRVLAETLAQSGHTVLRFDYAGTGDSSGDQSDPDRLAAWTESLSAAASMIRDLGCEQVTVIGVRLGATLSLLSGGRLGAERIVAWSPVVSGRRFAKELRMMSIPVPEVPGREDLSDAIVSAGNVFSTETLTALGRITVAAIDAPPAPSVLLVDEPAGPAEAVAERLSELGASVRHVCIDGGDAALQTPPEFATVPAEILTEIVDWLGADDTARRPVPVTRSRVAMRWGEAELTEEIVHLRPQGHAAVITSPADPDPSPVTTVFLNPGSETHVGPGRAWVEFARMLAGSGHVAVRVDFLGWGESPDAGRAPGRPYDACGISDVGDVVRELRAAGHERIVLVGLCASAWIALQATLVTPVDGVIALNPQMYWQQGDPVEIDWDLIRARRAAEIERIDRGARHRVWDALDLIGHRPPAGRWLDALAATRTPTHLVFAEGDDGLKFLSSRLGRRLSRVQRGGSITVSELSGVDHPLHFTWARPVVAQTIRQALLAITQSPVRQVSSAPS